ncbi:hypothetical protein [Siphonobacter sp. SORGH_AS_0500]|uniref:hypothetical protein n=1 Tax=Siphonobacter sp. SORGH_AS_0500 TaxID=1864824 RepID=UPI0028544216|nr:hypothetical protein [Siphonobacter sp. SORGH_AS_0500]MDR6195941.1 hypothetical protein [Siphonobacter sp. SORGH_AS_0500]
MPFDRKKYHPKWSLITRMVRRRAANCCEECRVKNDRFVIRGKGKQKGTYRYATGCEIIEFQGLRLEGVGYWKAAKQLGMVRVVLTISHLDRDRKNNRFDNLKALCQYCHLNYDRPVNNWLKAYGKNESTLPLFN